ncbi:MAG: hypothetical protein Q9167_007480 [Letrouitia subvulpina]
MACKAAPHIAFEFRPTFEDFQAFEKVEQRIHSKFSLYSRMVVTEREIFESKTRPNRLKKILRKTWDRISLRRTKIFSNLAERKEARALSSAAKSSKLAKTYRVRTSFDRFSKASQSRSNTTESLQSSASIVSTNHGSHEDLRPESRDLLQIRTFESIVRTPLIEPEDGSILTHSPATTDLNVRRSGTTLIRTTTSTTTASFTTALEETPQTSNEENIPLVSTSSDLRHPRLDRGNSNKTKRFSNIRIEGRKQVLLDMDRGLTDEKAPLGKSWLREGGGIQLNQGPKRNVHIDLSSLDNKSFYARVEKTRD